MNGVENSGGRPEMNPSITKVVYPGSFDPITLGHVDIIQRLNKMFSEVVILVAHSPNKQSLFTAAERMDLIHKIFKGVHGIKVDTFTGLTTEYMKKNQIRLIVRGLRAVSDYEYEQTMAQMNKKLFPDCETFFMQSDPNLTFISSRGVREVALNGGNLDGLIPPEIFKDLQQKILKGS